MISASNKRLIINNNNNNNNKNNNKKRTCQIVDFVPADHRVKLKKDEKRDKHIDFGGELKKLCNMNVTVILIVVDALGTIPKGLVKEMEDLEITGQVETIQTTTLLRSARILRRVLETYLFVLPFFNGISTFLGYLMPNPSF